MRVITWQTLDRNISLSFLPCSTLFCSVAHDLLGDCQHADCNAGSMMSKRTCDWFRALDTLQSLIKPLKIHEQKFQHVLKAFINLLLRVLVPLCG